MYSDEELVKICGFIKTEIIVNIENLKKNKIKTNEELGLTKIYITFDISNIFKTQWAKLFLYILNQKHNKLVENLYGDIAKITETIFFDKLIWDTSDNKIDINKFIIGSDINIKQSILTRFLMVIFHLYRYDEIVIYSNNDIILPKKININKLIIKSNLTKNSILPIDIKELVLTNIKQNDHVIEIFINLDPLINLKKLKRIEMTNCILIEGAIKLYQIKELIYNIYFKTNTIFKLNLINFPNLNFLHTYNFSYIKFKIENSPSSLKNYLMEQGDIFETIDLNKLFLKKLNRLIIYSNITEEYLNGKTNQVCKLLLKILPKSIKFTLNLHNIFNTEFDKYIKINSYDELKRINSKSNFFIYE
jgi:hypothetical protein